MVELICISIPYLRIFSSWLQNLYAHITLQTCSGQDEYEWVLSYSVANNPLLRLETGLNPFGLVQEANGLFLC